MNKELQLVKLAYHAFIRPNSDEYLYYFVKAAESMPDYADFSKILLTYIELSNLYDNPTVDTDWVMRYNRCQRVLNVYELIVWNDPRGEIEETIHKYLTTLKKRAMKLYDKLHYIRWPKSN